MEISSQLFKATLIVGLTSVLWGDDLFDQNTLDIKIRKSSPTTIGDGKTFDSVKSKKTTLSLDYVGKWGHSQIKTFYYCQFTNTITTINKKEIETFDGGCEQPIASYAYNGEGWGVRMGRQDLARGYGIFANPANVLSAQDFASKYVSDIPNDTKVAYIGTYFSDLATYETTYIPKSTKRKIPRQVAFRVSGFLWDKADIAMEYVQGEDQVLGINAQSAFEYLTVYGEVALLDRKNYLIGASSDIGFIPSDVFKVGIEAYDRQNKDHAGLYAFFQSDSVNFTAGYAMSLEDQKNEISIKTSYVIAKLFKLEATFQKPSMENTDYIYDLSFEANL